MTTADTTEQDHCGCCGREIPTIPDQDDWCGYCRKHVRPQLHYGHLSAWERTYYAQFGQECPFTEH